MNILKNFKEQLEIFAKNLKNSHLRKFFKTLTDCENVEM